MDVGEDVRRNRSSKAIAKLSDTVQGMMASWTEENFPMFNETMELIRLNDPVQWAKLYLESVKMGIVKQSEININISRQKDRDDLQALVRSRIPLTDKGTYTPYEEVKPEPLPLSREKGEEDSPTPLPSL
jgi:hypothetical protein